MSSPQKRTNPVSQSKTVRDTDAHGRQLKPGDVVYGPCPLEDGSVLPRHWGVVLDAQPGKTLVVYTTSEKEAHAASQMSFTKKDFELSEMGKASHWSASQGYSVPGEALEHRGRVSDETFRNIYDAVSKRVVNYQFHTAHLDRNGDVTVGNSPRPVAHWDGYEKAKLDAQSHFKSERSPRGQTGNEHAHREGAHVHHRSKFRGPGSTYEVAGSAVLVAAAVVNRLADGRGADTQVAEFARALERSPVSYPAEKATELMEAAAHQWREKTGLPTPGDLTDKAIEAALDTKPGHLLMQQLERAEQWLNEKNKPEAAPDKDAKGRLLSQADTAIPDPARVNALVATLAKALDADVSELSTAQCSQLADQLSCASEGAALALTPEGHLKVASLSEQDSLPEGTATLQAQAALEFLGTVASRDIAQVAAAQELAQAEGPAHDMDNSELVMEA